MAAEFINSRFERVINCVEEIVNTINKDVVPTNIYNELIIEPADHASKCRNLKVLLHL